MKMERFIRVLAGTVTFTGTLLGAFVNPWWLVLPAFAGFNLVQSAFTGFCPPSLLLRRLGWLDDDNIIHWGGKKS